MYRNEAAGLARPGSTRFVATGIVKLRATPERTGHVLAKLPVNTPVTVLEARAVPRGWLAVRLASEPPMFGYVAAAFVSRRPRDAASIVERRAALRAAGGHEVVKASLDRLADAAAPGRASLLKKLKSMYSPLATAAAERRFHARLKVERTIPPGAKSAGGIGRDVRSQDPRSWRAHNRSGGKWQETSQRRRESDRRTSVIEVDCAASARAGRNVRGTKS